MRRTRLTLLTVAMLCLLAAMSFFWIGCQNDPTSSQITTATILPGDPVAIAKAMVIQDKITDQLLTVPNVVGTGTTLDADGNPAIIVFTTGPLASVGKIATEYDGIPVVIEETGEITAFQLTGTYRPVPIGVSIGNVNECASGTLGCVVYKGSTPYILSNNHVMARENYAAIGEDINQPGLYDTKCALNTANKIADLSDFEPIKFDGTNNYIDAAIAQFSTTDFTCATLPTYYGLPGATTVSPAVGLAVKKVGRTTSLTTGTITAINVTVNVGYTHGTAKFVGQFMTSTKFTKAGDSGSLVVTNNTSENPVGLLFAGTKTGQAICNPIGTVLTRFSATICTQ